MYQTSQVKIVTEQMLKVYGSPIKVLTDKSRLSKPTVEKFLNLEYIKPSNVEVLYDLCLDLLEEKNKKIENNLKRVKRLTTNVSAPLEQVKLELNG